MLDLLMRRRNEVLGVGVGAERINCRRVPHRVMIINVFTVKAEFLQLGLHHSVDL